MNIKNIHEYQSVMLNLLLAHVDMSHTEMTSNNIRKRND